MENDPYPKPGYNDWRAALPHPGQQWNEARLNQLCETAPPAETLYELTTHINKQFFVSHQNPMLGFWGSACAAKLHPLVDAARKRLGWQQRYIDLQILRELRRETKLCLTIGAGVTIDAGGPSWPNLVSGLIEIALGKEHEIARILPDPDGKLGDGRYIKEIVPVPPLATNERDELGQIREHISGKGAGSDTKLLMRAAEISHSLFGQQLLKHISDAVYSRAPRPGPIHRAIAEVASQPRVSRRFGTWPAWGSIINYNFDGLLFDAFNEAGVPQLICLTQADQQQVWYKFPDQDFAWRQPVFHVHGFTPSWRMNITHTKFVFSESQYAEAYTRPATSLVDVIRKNLLARPPIICLYVGCSFADEAMNQVLTEAWLENFGRMHYALLQWPEKRGKHEPTTEEIERHSARYTVMGVQPIWFDMFEEIPELIRSLK